METEGWCLASTHFCRRATRLKSPLILTAGPWRQCFELRVRQASLSLTLIQVAWRTGLKLLREVPLRVCHSSRNSNRHLSSNSSSKCLSSNSLPKELSHKCHIEDKCTACLCRIRDSPWEEWTKAFLHREGMLWEVLRVRWINCIW